jgi:hypothetical protein
MGAGAERVSDMDLNGVEDDIYDCDGVNELTRRS